MIALWHWIVHVTGCDYGLPYGHFAWYNLYSGIGGSYLIAGIAFAAGWWLSRTCQHSPWCLRRGRFAIAGGLAKECYKHHPDLAHLEGRKPRGADLHRLHREWRQAGGAR